MEGFLKRIQVFAVCFAVVVLLLKWMKAEAVVGATVEAGPKENASILPFATIIARSQKTQSQANVSFSRNANANSAMTLADSIYVITPHLLKCNGGEKRVETPTNPSPPNSLLTENTSAPHYQALIRPQTFISRTPSSSYTLNFTISASHGPCLMQCLTETSFQKYQADIIVRDTICFHQFPYPGTANGMRNYRYVVLIDKYVIVY
ncbi:hypothetical protein V8G54_007899 [Vigna mungo]|uniref:Uncharacterized protein n=1 Tax=Vigna mungo TaxID=3915 RepID=A0AAQ3P4L3_VIGMU